MLPVFENYKIFPAVVRADVETEMTILPAGRAFLFFEGEEYAVTLVPMNGDENYYVPHCRETVKVTAKDGVLRFAYTFESEQEHLVFVSYNDKKLATLSVYSLKEDLYALRPLRGDFHSHSYRSDGSHDPAEAASHFREQGYDFYALTDHNRYYPGGEVDEVYAGVKMDFTRVLGEELHTPGSVVHIVHVGGKESITARYFKDPETYEREVDECRPRVPDSVPEAYRDRYARAIWATDKIHSVGGLAIFAHPYWRPGNKVFNVTDEFAKILLCSGMFDAYELIGGMGQYGNNRSVVLWAELRAEAGLKISVVGSSDVHGMQGAGTFPYHFTLCFAEKNENDAIIRAVKDGMCVAVDAQGEDYAKQNRVYGSLRLVSYAHFLLQRYYPALQRICQGEGVAMRAYAMGQEDKSLIEVQAAATESFRRTFFGECPPVLPSADVLAFEERWRAVHLAGPETKGSLVFADVPTRQI
ncbi:MAG: hypothetical protein J6B77_08680 [Clostridia bacterium]|nr:hypothetical protein [Clostridia bacterium]